MGHNGHSIFFFLTVVNLGQYKWERRVNIITTMTKLTGMSANSYIFFFITEHVPIVLYKYINLLVLYNIIFVFPRLGTDVI